MVSGPSSKTHARNPLNAPRIFDAQSAEVTTQLFIIICLVSSSFMTRLIIPKPEKSQQFTRANRLSKG